MTKNVFRSIGLLIFSALYIFTFTGCQAAPARADVSGSWLGRDIDECYAAWGITPGENALKIGGDMEDNILLTVPVDYLGNKFFAKITYPVGQGEFYHNKIDSIVYFKDYYKSIDETVAEKAAELFAVLQKEYGIPNQVSVIHKTSDTNGAVLTNGSDADAMLLQKDGIAQEMKNSMETGEQLSILCAWNLPEEYEKLDSSYVNAMEEHNNCKSTYSVLGNLEYVEGRYIFSVTHTFGRVKTTA